MSLVSSIANEYLFIIDRIAYGNFSSIAELRWLEGQRGMLHAQLESLTLRSITTEDARRLAAASR